MPSPSSQSSQSSQSSPPRTVQAYAPINIALVKYWGKADEDAMLPLNDSISITLTTEPADSATPAANRLGTLTTIIASPSSPSTDDSFCLNGTPHPLGARIRRCLEVARAQRGPAGADPRWPLRIESTNGVPTGAGLASSASGMAALAAGLAALYAIAPAHVPMLARLGSGSACRSLAGGFVRWHAGDGHVTALPSDWPLLGVVVVLSARAKDVPSAHGMQDTARTSPSFQHRLAAVVPEHLALLADAIARRDFDALAGVAMRDSNNFHACCLDTQPPLRYLSDASWACIQLVTRINALHPRNVLAYTFDAGPNAVILAEHQHHLDAFLAALATTAPCIPFRIGPGAFCLSPDLDAGAESMSGVHERSA